MICCLLMKESIPFCKRTYEITYINELIIKIKKLH